MANPDEDVQSVYQAVGELIMWGAELDAQLTRAIILLFTLEETPFLEPVIAELDSRAKAELLKIRAKNINKNPEWKNGITKWVKKVEIVNQHRNTVAHHRLGFEKGRPVLYAEQARKIFKSIQMPEKKIDPKNGIAEIQTWIKKAEAAHAQGVDVLHNLERFAKLARNIQKKKKRKA
jgi:hypothetical protein